MRIDKYLKLSRLVKRRPVANTLCDGGKVLLNGKPARASAPVKAGDRIQIRFGNRRLEVEILEVPERNPSSKQGAEGLYRLLSETATEPPSL